MADGLWHATPRVPLPLGRHLPPVNRLGRWLTARALRRWLAARPGDRLLWIDEDLAAPVVGQLGEAAVVYDTTDLDWTFTRWWNRWHLRAALRAAVAAADLVLVSSRSLPPWLPRSRRAPVLLANACDPDQFTPAGPVAPDLAGLRRPLLGYVGAIDTRAFDGELVAQVARAHPEWTFVLAGPSTRAGRRPLAGLANVRLLGPVDHADVPVILRSCDATLIPYRLGGLIDYVHPKKCYEYLALGKPVVATPLPAIVGSPELGGAHATVRCAAGAGAFAAAIAAVLPVADHPEAVARRRAVAVANSWSARGRDLQVLLGALRTGAADRPAVPE